LAKGVIQGTALGLEDLRNPCAITILLWFTYFVKYNMFMTIYLTISVNTRNPPALAGISQQEAGNIGFLGLLRLFKETGFPGSR
jgi:hypothetical protein